MNYEIGKTGMGISDGILNVNHLMPRQYSVEIFIFVFSNFISFSSAS